MNYRITGLDPAPFRDLYGMDQGELLRRGVHRSLVTTPHSAPDRIELRDAEPGETVLLLNHVYLDAASPYRGTHAIYVREWAEQCYDSINQVPLALQTRLISLRAFDANANMVDAEVTEGTELEPLIEQFLSRREVTFLHAHHARRGCYAARILRA